MKKIIIGLAFFFFCGIPLSWATPPTAINLSYDPDLKVLHIEVMHTSSNPRHHYIRRISVTVNNQIPTDYSYASQVSTAHQLQDMTLEAVPGDSIKVEAICNKAGRLGATLVVPQPPAPTENK